MSAAVPTWRNRPSTSSAARVAHGVDAGEVVRDVHERGARANELLHALDAADLEAGVADRQRLVDDEDVGPHPGGDREAEAELHA